MRTISVYTHFSAYIHPFINPNHAPMDLYTKTKAMFPQAQAVTKISDTEVVVEFTEAESAKVQLIGSNIMIACTCPALRDDFYMDCFWKRSTRHDHDGVYYCELKAEDYYLDNN